jgi:eukaryotic-like serine/threonine-protein kinase
MRSGQLLTGRYRLDGCLGAGGMSVVWRAHDEILDRPVAVKVLAATHASTPAEVRRIREEAQAAARLWHPNVTSVYDYGEATGDLGERLPYVVMELLPGVTLHQRIAEGPLPATTALRICAEVAAALAESHAQGVVHRDVKPSNVMLTPAGAKVLDFGIAARAGQPDVEADGTVLGSPAYVAPERLDGEEVAPASDVFALGVLMYLTLSGKRPWPADTPTQMVAAHVGQPPADLLPIDGVPDDVRRIVERCLARDPDARPSAADVVEVLTTTLDAGPAASASAGPASAPAGPASAPAGPASAPAGPATVVAAGIPSEAPAGDTVAVRVSARPRRVRTLALVGAPIIAALSAVSLALLTPDTPVADRAAAPAPVASTTAGRSTPPPQSVLSTLPPIPGGELPSAAPPGDGRVSPGPTGRPRRNTVPPPAPITAPPPPAPGTDITSLGGVVRVLCVDGKAQVLSVQPGPGYEIKDSRPGPADEIRVILRSPANESEVKSRCNGDQPRPEVKEHPK